MARDLRNESRNWPSVGNQKFLDLGLNAFGLELFVESYWDTISKMVGDDFSDPAKWILTLPYRGMTITLDPTVGFAAVAPKSEESPSQQPGGEG